MSSEAINHDVLEELTLLVYELLDAHGDTVRLWSGGGEGREWDVHVEYLQRLQRLGRGALARANAAASASSLDLPRADI